MPRRKVEINVAPPLTLLFLVLLCFKLTKQIDWSWWLVTAPLWFPFAFLAALFVVFSIISGFVGGGHGKGY